jgi:hypothetical protein
MYLALKDPREISDTAQHLKASCFCPSTRKSRVKFTSAPVTVELNVPQHLSKCARVPYYSGVLAHVQLLQRIHQLQKIASH